MDQVESSPIRKVLIKEIDTDIFSELCPPPILWEPFKVLELLLVLWLAVETNWNGGNEKKSSHFCQWQNNLYNFEVNKQVHPPPPFHNLHRQEIDTRTCYNTLVIEKTYFNDLGTCFSEPEYLL
jgi:hypothetical protein